MVADLMLDGSRVQDKGKIENTLSSVDHEIISGIPLGNGVGGDKWAWHFYSKGLYKVRAGYRAIMESKRSESSSIVNSGRIMVEEDVEFTNSPQSPFVCMAWFP